MSSIVYLDHSATTPVDPAVLDAMIPYFTQVYGNASSGHGIGQAAERAIESARETVAEVFGCTPEEIVFTSGGSESDNLAVRGAAFAARHRGRHLVTTSIEHGAVGKTVEQLATEHGFTRTVLQVGQDGKLNAWDFAAALESGTTLASIIYANNEIGTVQDIPELATIARARGVLFHTDAVQAAGQLTLDVNTLGVDLLSISAHKFYGPKGVGALYIRKGVEVQTQNTGGGHERGLRAGTQNTPLIVGLAKALKLAYSKLSVRTAHYAALRDRLISGILHNIPNARLTGHATDRLPSHASFVFEGIHNGFLLSQLDAKGIAGSAASACKTGSAAPSSVLLAAGYAPELAASSLRLTVGVHTTEADIDYTIETLTDIVAGLTRKAASAA